MKEIKQYLEDLELSSGDDSISFPQMRSDDLESFDTIEGETGVMNFKSLQSFAAGLTKERQDDVLNSLLLAQRAATKAFPNDDQIMDWYKKYFEVLDRLGWVFENKEFLKFNSSNNLFEIENALLEILGAALTGNQLAILLKTIESLKSLGSGDKRFVAFEQNTHSLQKGSFQLGVATEENNTLSISACAFILNTRKKILKILFFSSDKDSTDLKYFQSKATLNDSIFADARETIKQRLGDVSSFVADLEI